ncbi:MAG: hypothetical protein GY928_17020 [Colwellia sp.]|nr:hypothetical protein [Colwellia sp.]
MSEHLKDFHKLRYQGTGGVENSGHSCKDEWIEFVFPTPPLSGSTFRSAHTINSSSHQSFYNPANGILSGGTYYIEIVNEHVTDYDRTDGFKWWNWGWEQGDILMGDKHRFAAKGSDGSLILHDATDLSYMGGMWDKVLNPTVIPQVRSFTTNTFLQFGNYSNVSVKNCISRIFIVKTDATQWRRTQEITIPESFSKLSYDNLNGRSAFLSFTKEYSSYTGGLVADPTDLNMYRTNRTINNYGTIAHPLISNFESQTSGVDAEARMIGQYQQFGVNNLKHTAGMNGFYRNYTSCSPTTERSSSISGGAPWQKTDPRSFYCIAKMEKFSGDASSDDGLNIPLNTTTVNPSGNRMETSSNYLRLSATAPTAEDNPDGNTNVFDSLGYHTRMRPNARNFIYDVSHYGALDENAPWINKNSMTTGLTQGASDLSSGFTDNWFWLPESVGNLVVLVTVLTRHVGQDLEVTYGSDANRPQTRIVNSSHPTVIFRTSWWDMNRGVIDVRMLDSSMQIESINITRVILGVVGAPNWG